MLVPVNIRVWTLSRDSLTISWAFRNTTAALGDYSITVLRSGSAAGGYEEISSAFAADATVEFVDSEVVLHSKWREYFYRLRVTAPDGSTTDFGSVDYKRVLAGDDAGGVVLESLPDLVALEAIRRFDMLLQTKIGRELLVLNHRSTGQRCAECWDNLKRRRTKSKCLTCYGVGVSGGYYFPKQAWAAKVPHRASVQLTPLFEMQNNDALLWMSSRPRVVPRDLVIDADGRRWRVIDIQRHEKLWALTRQTVQVRELSKDQVEYDIPISADEWDIDPVAATPYRQYINATNLDSHRRAKRELGL